MAHSGRPRLAGGISPTDTAARLRAAAGRLGVQLDEASTSRLLAFAAELLRWNARVDLIGPADLETVVTRHLLDSVAPLPLLLHAGVRRLADLGSGAGLPGLVLAIAEPRLEVVSIEPRQRRAAFQRHAVRLLALANVRVEARRIEAAGGRAAAAEGTEPSPEGRRAGPVAGAPFDAVLGRALAALPDFLALAAGLVRPGGLVVAMRGPGADEEAIAAAPTALRLGLVLEARREYRLPGDRWGRAGERVRVLLAYRAGGAGGARMPGER